MKLIKFLSTWDGKVSFKTELLNGSFVYHYYIDGDFDTCTNDSFLIDEPPYMEYVDPTHIYMNSHTYKLKLCDPKIM